MKGRQYVSPTGVSSVTGAFLLAAMIGICLFAATTARADVASIMAQLKSGSAEFGQIEAQKAELTRASEQEMKAYNAYESSHAQLEAELTAKVKAFADTQKKELKAADGLVDGWNRRCAAEHVGQLPEPAYNKCVSEKAQLEPIVTAKRDRVAAAQEQFKSDLAKDPRLKFMSQQEKGMAEITARIKQRHQQWTALDDRAKALKPKLAAYRAQLVDECRTATAPEALKHCYSIGWDNAAKTLPTIEEIVPRAREWPGG